MQSQDFASLLNHFLRREISSLGRISALSGISLRTLENWRTGITKRPRHWQDVLKVCKALSLSKEEASKMLLAANHQSIDVLYKLVREDEESTEINLFSLWEHRLQQPVPMVKPPRVPYFTGRENIIRKVSDLLIPGEVVALCGPGGIGKSSLAAEIVWDISPTGETPTIFPDGIFFHSFYTVSQIDIAFEEIARAFGENPHGESPFLAAKRAIEGKQALLILDGTEVTDSLSKLLSITSTCGVLITSRRREDAQTIRFDLHTLTMANSLTLLKHWGGSRVDDIEAAKRICLLVDGLPLALTIIGKYLSEREEYATEYLGWLETTPLKALDSGRRQHESIPILLKKSLNKVHPRVFEVMMIIGLLAPKPFDRDLFGWVSDLPEAIIHSILGELVNYGLLHRPSEQYAVSHLLVHTFAANERRGSYTAVSRILDWFEPKITKLPQLNTLSPADRAHILHLLEFCQSNQIWEPIEEIALPFEKKLNLTGHWAKRNQVITIGTSAAKASNDNLNLAIWLSRLGTALSDEGKTREAISYFSDSIKLFKQLNNLHEEAIVLERLSLIHLRLSEYETAESYCRTALHIAQQLGDIEAEAKFLNTLARINRLNDDHERAFHHVKQSIQKARLADDRFQEQISLGNFGRIFIDTADFQSASRYLSNAANIAQQVGSKRHEIAHLISLGLSYFFLGKWKEDLACQTKALSMAKQLNYKQLEAFIYSNFAHVEIQQGKPQQAFDSYQKSIDLFQSMGNLSAELTQRNNQLPCLVLFGEHKRALSIVNRNLDVSYHRGFVTLISQGLGKKGSILRYLNQLEDGLAVHQEAIEMTKTYDSDWDRAVWNKELGIDFHAIGDLETAVSHYHTAYDLLKEMKGVPWQAMLLAYLLVAQSEQNDHTAIRQVSDELSTLTTTNNQAEFASRLLKELGDMFHIINQPSRSAICYEKREWLTSISANHP